MFRKLNRLLRDNFVEPERNGNLFFGGEDTILEDEDLEELSLDNKLDGVVVRDFVDWVRVLDIGLEEVTLSESK